MRALVFDTGPIISLAMNNLLWILKPLKERFKGEFYITHGVKKECVEKPLTSKKFKYEAIQVMRLIREGIIKVYDTEALRTETLYLLEFANTLFKAHGSYIRIVQYAEIESVMAAKHLNAEAVVIDEFTTRNLFDDILFVGERLSRKLHIEVEADKPNISRISERAQGIYVIRSLELVTIAYELGFFREYYPSVPHSKRTLLDALLWAVKLSGCSVSEREIAELKKAEKV